MKKILSLLLFFSLIYAQALLQKDEEEITEEEFIYYENIKIDPNTAKEEELLQIPGMKMEWIKKIKEERKKKKFEDIDELFSRVEIPEENRIILKDFFYFPYKKVKSSFKSLTKFKKDTISPFRSLNSCSFEMKNIKVLFLQEKDIGEKNFLDHKRGSVFYKSEKLKFAFGDYIIEKGLGLIYGYPTFFKESSLAYKNEAPFLRTYNSTSENKGFFGTAMQYKFLTLFYSYNAFDAETDTIGDTLIVVSNYELTGLHRNTLENSFKNILNEARGGGILSFHNTNFWINFSMDLTKTNYPIFLDGRKRDEFLNFSLDINIPLEQTEFTFEMKGERGKLEGIAGKLFLDFKRAKTGFSIHHLSPYNFDLHSSSLTDEGNARGEKGAGFFMKSSFKKMGFYTYSILFRKLNVLKAGHRFYFQGTYKIRKDISMAFELKRSISTTERNRLKLNFLFELSPDTKAGLRGDYVLSRENGKNFEKGNLFVVELQKYFIRTRFSFYKTDTYLSRVYIYENELSPFFELIPLYNEGYRFFIDMNQKFPLFRTYFKFGIEFQNLFLRYEKMGVVGIEVFL